MWSTVMLRGKLLVTAILAATTVAAAAELSSGKDINTNGLVPKNEATFGQGEPLAERKSCTPTISCTIAGGHCVKKRADCDGVLDPKGCTKGKKCKCCIPVPTTILPTPEYLPTCPVVTCETTPAEPTCPTVTCPTAPACTTPTPVLAPPACCELGGVRFGSQCLWFHKEYNNWNNSVIKCQEKGAQLAIIHSDNYKDVADFIDKDKNVHGGYYWLDATDQENEGVWVWGNGQEVTGLPWRGSNPDGGTNQNCLMVANDGYWDGGCSDRRYVLCDLGSTKEVLHEGKIKIDTN